LSGGIVSGVDLIDSVESSDISELISSGDHEVGEALPGGWGDINSSANISLVASKIKSRDLDTEEGWDDDTFSEESVKDGDVGGGGGLDFSLEGSSGHSGEDALERGRVDSTDVGGREGTEDGSRFGGNLSGSLDSVEFSIDGGFTGDGDGDS